VTPWRNLLGLALAAIILWRNLPAALLCLWPGFVRTRTVSEEGPSLDAGLFRALEEELAPLGFRRLGARIEKAPLRRPLACYDFAHDAERTFASAYRERGEVRLYFLTAFEHGGFVLTANHRRQGIERRGYLAGGIPGALPEQLLPVHRRRVERLVQEGQTPTGCSPDARLSAARDWIRGAGVRETRLRNANGLILSLMGLAMAIALFQSARRARHADAVRPDESTTTQETSR
jgi:hypothetical protein